MRGTLPRLATAVLLASCAPLVGMRPPVVDAGADAAAADALALTNLWRLDGSGRAYTGLSYSLAQRTSEGEAGGFIAMDANLGDGGETSQGALGGWVRPWLDDPDKALPGLHVGGGLTYAELGYLARIETAWGPVRLSPLAAVYPGLWDPTPPGVEVDEKDGDECGLTGCLGVLVPQVRLLLPLTWSTGPERRTLVELGVGAELGRSDMDATRGPAFLWAGFGHRMAVRRDAGADAGAGHDPGR